MRIAVVSSPRSGNTWVRSVLANSLDLTEIAIHNYLDAPRSLPDRCALQIHWYREPNFQQYLNENQFQTLVVGRHPLDILLSVLHFIRHEPATNQWLMGNAEIPTDLSGQGPTSDAFMEYALSWGAENLLSISYQWWCDRNSLRVKYEDLVASPGKEFSKVVETLCSGLSADKIDVAIKNFDFGYFHSMPNRHGWQGRPGLWRSLIPGRMARAIYARHRRLFDTLGYNVPYTLTSYRQAADNWKALS
ncbi:hypothetical protein [Paraburkholderia sp.]|uniref:hypothetical protein n=1 Tax=Paraburkholderia sp. TaxID=1926495 RepID=UPI003D6EDA33